MNAMDLLDRLTAWHTAQAALLKCRERCGGESDAAYFCGVLIEDEQDARAAYFHELRREIAARIASL